MASQTAVMPAAQSAILHLVTFGVVVTPGGPDIHALAWFDDRCGDTVVSLRWLTQCRDFRRRRVTASRLRPRRSRGCRPDDGRPSPGITELSGAAGRDWYTLPRRRVIRSSRPPPRGLRKWRASGCRQVGRAAQRGPRLTHFRPSPGSRPTGGGWGRVGFKDDLAGDAPDGRRTRCDECAPKPRDHCVTRQDDDRAPTDLGHLAPPDLTARGSAVTTARRPRNDARSPHSSASSSGCSS